MMMGTAVQRCYKLAEQGSHTLCKGSCQLYCVVKKYLAILVESLVISGLFHVKPK